MELPPILLLAMLLGSSVLMLIQAWDWSAVAKVWGPLGVGCAVLLLFVWKILLPWIKKQQEDTKNILMSALDDARKERDLMRQLREAEVDKFVNSLKLRDEKMERGLDEVVRALRDIHR